MPYPSQVTQAQIVETARQLIEANGVEYLSVHALAEALKIKAPSLYNHIQSKNALLKAVNTRTTAELFIAIQTTLEFAPPDPMEQLLEVSKAYRVFALEQPHNYTLAMNNTQDELRPDESYLLQLALPLQALIAQICGDENSLSALRGIFALLHGFAMLEITNQLRRGGDVRNAFLLSVQAYLRGWSDMYNREYDDPK